VHIFGRSSTYQMRDVRHRGWRRAGLSRHHKRPVHSLGTAKPPRSFRVHGFSRRLSPISHWQRWGDHVARFCGDFRPLISRIFVSVSAHPFWWRFLAAVSASKNSVPGGPAQGAGSCSAFRILVRSRSRAPASLARDRHTAAAATSRYSGH
jgi:hypothetical protein